MSVGGVQMLGRRLHFELVRLSKTTGSISVQIRSSPIHITRKPFVYSARLKYLFRCGATVVIPEDSYSEYW